MNRHRNRGHVIFFPVRYADDFIILVGAPPGDQQAAHAERGAHAECAALGEFLRRELGLELSETKTLVTPVANCMRFLGHHVRVRRHPEHQRMVSACVIPKSRSLLMRERVKHLFEKGTTHRTLGDQLQQLNPMLRGWANYYRHAWGAKKVFSFLDHYVWCTIDRWLKKKHRISTKRLANRYGWRKPGGRAVRWKDGNTRVFETSTVRVEQYKLGWINNYFGRVDGEPGAQRKVHAGFGRGQPENDSV